MGLKSVEIQLMDMFRFIYLKVYIRMNIFLMNWLVHNTNYLNHNLFGSSDITINGFLYVSNTNTSDITEDKSSNSNKS